MANGAQEVQLANIIIEIPAAVTNAPAAKMTFEVAPKGNAKSAWNSLEFAKIFVSAFTSAVVGYVGYSATVTIHKEDVARAAKEDMRKRGLAILPLIGDLRTRYLEFGYSIDAFYKDMQTQVSQADKEAEKANMDALESRSKREYDAYYEPINGDLENIKALLLEDRRNAWKEIIDYYDMGVHQPYAAMSRICTVQLQKALGNVAAGKWEKFRSACAQHLSMRANSKACLEYVDYRLRALYSSDPFDNAALTPKSCEASRDGEKKLRDDNKELFAL